MAQRKMNAQDAVSSREGVVTCAFTDPKGTRRRFEILAVKNVSATASISTEEVKTLGTLISGRKANGMEVKVEFTIYKTLPFFDRLITYYKETGILPVFDLTVKQYDKSSSVGADTKTYRNMVVDGDVILSLLDVDGGPVEQTISAYAEDYDYAKGDSMTIPANYDKNAGYLF